MYAYNINKSGKYIGQIWCLCDNYINPFHYLMHWSINADEYSSK